MMLAVGYRMMWIITMTAFLTAASGCARTIQRSVEDEVARSGTGIVKEQGQSIRGYHSHDGTKETYTGWVRLAEQDSLVFWSEGYSDEVSHQGIKKKIIVPGPVFPREAVKSLDVRETRATRTALLVAAGIIVVVSVIGLATMDTMSGTMTWDSP